MLHGVEETNLLAELLSRILRLSKLGFNISEISVCHSPGWSNLKYSDQHSLGGSVIAYPAVHVSKIIQGFDVGAVQSNGFLETTLRFLEIRVRCVEVLETLGI